MGRLTADEGGRTLQATRVVRQRRAVAPLRGSWRGCRRCGRCLRSSGGVAGHFAIPRRDQKHSTQSRDLLEALQGGPAEAATQGRDDDDDGDGDGDAMASDAGVCGVELLQLYLADPGNSNFPEDYAPCADFRASCLKDGCACRQPASATAANGSTLDFVVCVLLNDDAACAGSGELACANQPGLDSSAPGETMPTTAAPAATTAAPAATTATPAATTATPAATAATSTSTPASRVSSGSESAALGESSSSASAASSWSGSASASGSTEGVASTSDGSSLSSMTTVVTVSVVLIFLLFAGLTAWFSRAYCVKRAAQRRKQQAHSDGAPTASPRAMHPTPTSGSFPALDRARATSAPRSRSGSNSRQHTSRSRSHRARSRGVLPPPSHSSHSTESSGASVFSGAVTNDGAAFFAQQAAFEAPDAVTRPRQASRPVQSVRLGEPLALSSTTSSGNTTVSSAPSSASTVVAGGRGRPPPPPVPTEEPRDLSAATSDSLSSLAWSSASELSDSSGFYHLAPSRSAAIAVMGATPDDDISELGAYRQRSVDAGRSTAASSSSFFSVASDFTDDEPVDRRRGSRLGSMKEREF